tara:strand:- start:2614 stop:3705 length:1092 start_codon:yes stop_codon:yes gene_type:complete
MGENQNLYEKNFLIKHSKKDSEVDEKLKDEFGERWSKYRQLWSDLTFFKVETKFPTYVLFEFSSACNLKCPMCNFGAQDKSLRKPYNGVMNFKTFTKICDELNTHECPAVKLSGNNEPLIYPDLFKRIDYLKKHTRVMDIIMSTNGLLLDKNIVSRLLDNPITKLCISIDAASKETYEKIRIGSDFHRVKNNILNLLEEREKRNSKFPIIRLSFLEMDSNAHEVEPFIKFWIDKVDYIDIQCYRPLLNTGEFKKLDLKDEAKKEKFSNANSNVDNRCSIPFERVMITGDGSVLLCCEFYRKELIFGNIIEDSIYTIWNSRKTKNFREMHKIGNDESQKHPVCGPCLLNTYGESYLMQLNKITS